jgi:hypothetical protein
MHQETKQIAADAKAPGGLKSLRDLGRDIHAHRAFAQTTVASRLLGWCSAYAETPDAVEDCSWTTSLSPSQSSSLSARNTLLRYADFETI